MATAYIITSTTLKIYDVNYEPIINGQVGSSKSINIWLILEEKHTDQSRLFVLIKHQCVTGIDHSDMDYQTMKVHYYVIVVTI